jgi:hypothetical protein
MSTGGQERVEMSGALSVVGRVEGRRGGLEVYMWEERVVGVMSSGEG